MATKFMRMDNNPGAIINTDNEGLQAYKLAKKRAAAQTSELNNLKQQIEELKSMVTQLLEKNK